MSQQLVFTVAFVACLFAGILLLLEAGRRFGIRRKHDREEEGAGFGAVEGAVFGLLGLLIAFTFSGAADRFNARRTLIADEANAAEAAYMYVGMLPAETQLSERKLIRQYLDVRLAIYRKLPNFDHDGAEMRRSEELRKQIWNEALAGQQAGSLHSGAPIYPALVRMFEVGNLRIVALQTHSPGMIFAVLIVLAFACALLAGYGMSRGRTRSWMHTLGFAAILAISVYVILDLEYPRAGLIKIDSYDQVLIDVRKAME
jgi:hypothetical protein